MVLKTVVRIHNVDGIVVQFAPLSHRHDVGRVGGAGDGIDFEAMPLRCLLGKNYLSAGGGGHKDNWGSCW